MHPFDIVSLSLVLIFAVIGLTRGFISELFRLAAIAAGFIGALITYDSLYHYIEFIDIGSRAKTILSFILAFIGIALVVLLIGWVIRKIVHLAMLGWADRLLGAAAGGCKAALLIWLVVLSIGHLPDTDLRSALTSSISFRLLNNIPLHLRMPSIPRFEKESPTQHSKKVFNSFDNARKRLEDMRQRVDSLKRQTDTIQPAYSTNDHE